MSEGLPTRSQLLRACREDGPPPAHPVLVQARTLSDLHFRRLRSERGCGCGGDERRARLIREIDRWVEARLPVARGGAYLHTESFGSVVDRLARLSACAYAAMAGDQEWDLWFAWERLAEAAVAYEDLVGELSSGRRRLPSAF
ncbi:DUF4254 domain-containing protein [Nocardia implantans]|uniref:DUF4254 domain-containing protein n=1 Tax=Nocardia implantans TaxID=3108168 RepID=A0ABU6AU14_9NOCA|nr:MULTISPECIES: DUF4254 domain-containing protein [unclassified Nocardia]MEA3529186.1 DUF4254 domain-containing protein [Nocardia sp. CDC192]MEB3510851.1 DUF4254 domain-containing protein [Nocardia sp. CDC186]